MRVLVTGSLGFIGGHLVQELLRQGHRVISVDNGSRVGAEANLVHLESMGGDLRHFNTDIRDGTSLDAVVQRESPDKVVHLAAQVAVTKSLSNPRLDLETNVMGTFNLLESVRTRVPGAQIVFASTNKVYGNLRSFVTEEQDLRYSLVDGPVGISEDLPLKFSTPYGCSKGAADQYVLDWSETYSLPTTVFRQSCVYGERQLGIEDQGWVAWFAIAATLGRPISVYGTGKQVRDLLHVSDLIDAYMLALSSPATFGGVFNIGGGFDNSLSILEALNFLGDLRGKAIDYEFEPERPGDQKYFVSDNSRISRLGWNAKVSYGSGLERMMTWIDENATDIEKLLY